MDMIMDYYVWGAKLEHYQKHTPKLANVMPRWKNVLSTTQNDLLHEFIDKVNALFCNKLRSCVTATSGHCRREHSV